MLGGGALGSTAHILVVDDEQITRIAMTSMLEELGHDVVVASSGEDGLLRAAERPPDLVLCDVVMPGVDGFEVARRLKDSAAKRSGGFLPVIMVTSLGDHSSRMRALAAGADELLTKPIDEDELRVRVANMLALRAKERELERRNRDLAELHRFRHEMSALLVHDLKSPMTVIDANLTYLAGELPAGSEHLAAVQDAMLASRRMVRLIGNVLELERLESPRLHLDRSHIVLRDLIGPLLEERRRTLESSRITLDVQLSPTATAHVDPTLISRTVENLLDNAARYAPRGGRIGCEIESAKERALIRISNTGKPIPHEKHALIFEKYGQVGSQQGTNLGLGLYFCRLAVEAHGGRIGVAAQSRWDVSFEIDLPAG